MGWRTNLFSALIGLTAIGMTIFTIYPAPPYSPILFQWKEQGNYLKYKDFNIFYISK